MNNCLLSRIWVDDGELQNGNGRDCADLQHKEAGGDTHSQSIMQLLCVTCVTCVCVSDGL